jgi:hypothetical protein
MDQIDNGLILARLAQCPGECSAQVLRAPVLHASETAELGMDESKPGTGVVPLAANTKGFSPVWLLTASNSAAGEKIESVTSAISRGEFHVRRRKADITFGAVNTMPDLSVHGALMVNVQSTSHWWCRAQR